MSKPGRNDPCLCGGGKKYKKCCLISAEDSDFQYRRHRQIHAELIPKLTKFAFETIEPDLVEEAWKDFNDQQEEAFDPETPMNVLFMPWLLFNWIIELKPTGSTEFVETTIAELTMHNQSFAR
ncbi:MAG: SEC-C metal-binding domain-containing protein [bacterium]